MSRFVNFPMCALLISISLTAGGPPSQSNKPQPKTKRLDAGVEYRRDAQTGELRAEHVVRVRRELSAKGHAGGAPPPPAKISVLVNLVEVGVRVTSPAGLAMRGLRRDDFRIFEDEAEQTIAYFDAASEPARIALVIDASPSVFREFSEMKRAARALAANISPADEVAVVIFAGETYLTLSFTSDRKLLDRAIASLDVLRGDLQPHGSKVYESVYLAAEELFGATPEARGGRKAIVLLTDGQDSGLDLRWDPRSAVPPRWAPTPVPGVVTERLTFEDVCRTLAARGVEVYAVSTQPRPRGMTEEWLEANRAKPLVTPAARERGWPHYTLYLAELVRRAGGRLFFLGEIGTLAEVYRRVAENLGAQYVLGFYPAAGVSRTGWRALRVETRHDDAQVAHRPAYYLPATGRLSQP